MELFRLLVYQYALNDADVQQIVRVPVFDS